MSLFKTREFLLKEKIGSFRDKVDIYDSDGNEVGYFKGKIIKIGNTFRMYLPNDSPVMTIKEKLVSLKSTYTLYWGGEKEDDKVVGKLKKKLLSFRPKYTFEDENGKEMFLMKGRIYKLRYDVYKHGKKIAEINQKFFKSILRDTYGVKVDPNASDETTLTVLGIVIALHHEKEERQGH